MKKEISFFDLLSQTCFYPRQTTKTVLDKNPNLYFWPMAIIYTFGSSLGLSVLYYVLKHISWSTVFYSFLITLIYTFGSIFVNSWFLYWFGRQFDGKGSYEKVKTAYIWSMPPYVIAQILMVVHSGSLPQFTSIYPALSAGFILFISHLIGAFLIGWQVVLICVNLSEVHKFSIWKSIFVLIIGFALDWFGWWAVKHFFNIELFRF
jgi:hypothetical protein